MAGCHSWLRRSGTLRCRRIDGSESEGLKYIHKDQSCIDTLFGFNYKGMEKGGRKKVVRK
jgi:hypothetical protein